MFDFCNLCIRSLIRTQLHQWFGRAIALLGIAQVPLGLTLYGSPEYLFVLYSLYVAFLVILYFVLTYRHQRSISDEDMGSYVTGSGYGYSETQASHRGNHRGLKALAAAGVAGAGLKAMRSKSHQRRENRDYGYDTESYAHSRRRSDSVVDEKLASDPYDRRNTWKNRILGVTAGVGALAVLKRILGKNEQTSTVTDSSSYSGRLQGSRMYSQEDISRVEEGGAPISPEHGRYGRGPDHGSSYIASPARGGHHEDSVISRDTWEDESPSRERRNYGLKEGVAALGLAGFLRHKMKSSKGYNDRGSGNSRKHDMESERYNRRNSHRYTGDGYSPRRHRRHDSLSNSTPVIGSNPELARHRPVPVQSSVDSRANAENMRPAPEGSTFSIPPPPQPQFTPIEPNNAPSSSRRHNTSHDRHRPRHHETSDMIDEGEPAIAGPAATTKQRESSSTGSVASPPVSVKLNVHKDGRHVTLRRLNEAEAAAEREARRRERADRRQRAGSLTSGAETGDERWRRADNAEANQRRQNRGGRARASSSGKQMGNGDYSDIFVAPAPVPPPPITSSTGPDRTVTSPGQYETGTDVSNYDSNRRRRRAERAQAKLARAGGSRVEFE